MRSWPKWEEEKAREGAMEAAKKAVEAAEEGRRKLEELEAKVARASWSGGGGLFAAPPGLGLGWCHQGWA